MQDLPRSSAALVRATELPGCGAPAVLTHRGYWSGNTVWDGGVLTGIVDWTGAALGPRGFDVGWCMLDLYLLYGEDIANAFLDAYQAASGSAVTDVLLWGSLAGGPLTRRRGVRGFSLSRPGTGRPDRRKAS